MNGEIKFKDFNWFNMIGVIGGWLFVLWICVVVITAFILGFLGL